MIRLEIKNETLFGLVSPVTVLQEYILCRPRMRTLSCSASALTGVMKVRKVLDLIGRLLGELDSFSVQEKNAVSFLSWT